VREDEGSSSAVLESMEVTKNHGFADFIAAYDNLHGGEVTGVADGASRDAFDAFPKRQYWQRVWIIQESAVKFGTSSLL